MEFIHAILLGIIQGITEWLPISSQGVLTFVSTIGLGFSPQDALVYAIFLHLGTVCAAAWYFRKEILELLAGKNVSHRNFLFWALAGTAITGIPSYLFLKTLSGNVIVLLVLMGIGVFITGFLQRASSHEKNPPVSTKNSLLVGLGQGFSIIPGVSRSGITTAILLGEGFAPAEAFRLSFLLSIPTILGAEIVFGLSDGFVLDALSLVALLVSFGVGFVSLDFLVKVAQKIPFRLFCWGLSLVYFAAAALLFWN